MQLRMASQSDAPAMLGIYGQCIGTSITFELALPSVEDFTGRILSTQAEHPWIVCTDGSGDIIGYAYAHRLMGRGAYRWSAELSVYIDERHRGSGIAHALYGAILDILKMQGVVNVFACVTVPNRPSESFHRSMGFREVGRFHQAGYKAGGWHDVAWFEMELNPHADDPVDVTFLPEMDPVAVDACLRRAEADAGWTRSVRRGGLSPALRRGQQRIKAEGRISRPPGPSSPGPLPERPATVINPLQDSSAMAMINIEYRHSADPDDPTIRRRTCAVMNQYIKDLVFEMQMADISCAYKETVQDDGGNEVYINGMTISEIIEGLEIKMLDAEEVCDSGPRLVAFGRPTLDWKREIVEDVPDTIMKNAIAKVFADENKNQIDVIN